MRQIWWLFICLAIMILLILFATFIATGSLMPLSLSGSINPVVQSNEAAFFMISNFINDGWTTFGFVIIGIVLAFVSIAVSEMSPIFKKVLVYSIIIVILANSAYSVVSRTMGRGISGLAMVEGGIVLAFLSYIVNSYMKMNFNYVSAAAMLFAISYIPFIYGRALFSLLTIIIAIALLLYAKLRIYNHDRSGDAKDKENPKRKAITVWSMEAMFLDLSFLVLLLISAFPNIAVASKYHLDIIIHYTDFIIGFLVSVLYIYLGRSASSAASTRPSAAASAIRRAPRRR